MPDKMHHEKVNKPQGNAWLQVHKVSHEKKVKNSFEFELSHKNDENWLIFCGSKMRREMSV